jgi:hypothetical protein
MLVSLKAAGTGITLHAADYVFLLDPWWNPAVEAQAVDRVHRIGQTNTVFVYRMITAGTIEERIQALKASKKDLFDKLVGGLGGDFRPQPAFHLAAGTRDADGGGHRDRERDGKRLLREPAHPRGGGLPSAVSGPPESCSGPRRWHPPRIMPLLSMR